MLRGPPCRWHLSVCFLRRTPLLCHFSSCLLRGRSFCPLCTFPVCSLGLLDFWSLAKSTEYSTGIVRFRKWNKMSESQPLLPPSWPCNEHLWLFERSLKQHHQHLSLPKMWLGKIRTFYRISSRISKFENLLRRLNNLLLWLLLPFCPHLL